MHIIDALRAENERTLSLLKALEDTAGGQPARREQLLRDLCVQLIGTHRAEEAVLYPLVATEPGTAEVVAELRREYRALEILVKALQQLPKNEPNFQLQVEAMSSRVRAHLDREESELLPLAYAAAGSEGEEFGERLRRGAREAEAQVRN
jgi:hemerythrin-like domain-containing protein